MNVRPQSRRPRDGAARSQIESNLLAATREILAARGASQAAFGRHCIPHGDDGLRSILETVSKPGLSEADLLAAVEEESVARVRAKFGDGPDLRSTETRRHAFRTSPLISDQPLVLA
jgi:hypothetical protein